MNITIQQSDQVIERNVPASVVEYLYNLGQVSGITLSGSIYLDGGTYLNYTDALSQWYPELYITASKIYIAFQSSEVERVLLNNGYSTDGIGITQNDAQTLKTSITGSLFKNNSNISSFNELKYFTKVTTISSYAFQGSSLTEIDLSNINAVYNQCFSNCSNLTKINVSSLEDFYKISFSGNDYHFKQGTSLYVNGTKISGNITIPDTISQIKSNAFYNNKDITSVTFGDDLQLSTIRSDAFYGCTNLTSVNISDLSHWCGLIFVTRESNPLSIAKHLYLNGSEITDLIIPNDVTKISEYAFANDPYITSVTIPNSVTAIEDFAFTNCKGITSVIIPSSVINLGGFDRCTNLTSVTIPNSVVTLSNNAFNSCGLENITIPGSITSIPGGSGEGSGPFCGCNSLASVVIDNGVQRIEDGGSITYSQTGHYYSAFYNCKHLRSITIPPSLNYIGEYTFRECSQLYNIYISDLTAWCNITFGNAEAWSTTNHHLYLNGTEITDLVIPPGVTKINAYSFYRSSYITSVNIPSGVTIIDSNAFSYCSLLTSVDIPNTVTTIYSGAFRDCDLNSVVIPSSVTIINSYAFYNNKNITSITVEAETPPTMSGSALSNTGSCSIYVPEASVDAYKAASGWSSYASRIQAIPSNP